MFEKIVSEELDHCKTISYCLLLEPTFIAFSIKHVNKCLVYIYRT